MMDTFAVVVVPLEDEHVIGGLLSEAEVMARVLRPAGKDGVRVHACLCRPLTT